MGGLSMYCSTVHTVHTLSVCVYMSDDDICLLILVLCSHVRMYVHVGQGCVSYM